MDASLYYITLVLVFGVSVSSVTYLITAKPKNVPWQGYIAAILIGLVSLGLCYMIYGFYSGPPGLSRETHVLGGWLMLAFMLIFPCLQITGIWLTRGRRHVQRVMPSVMIGFGIAPILVPSVMEYFFAG